MSIINLFRNFRGWAISLSFIVLACCKPIQAENIIVDYKNNIYIFSTEQDKFISGWNWVIDENTLQLVLCVSDMDGKVLLFCKPEGNTINEQAASIITQMYNSKIFKYGYNNSSRGDTFSFDCSSLVGRIYQLLGKNFYSEAHTTYLQNIYFTRKKQLVKDKTNLQKGDIVYFGNDSNSINHCAVVTGYNKRGYEIISSKGFEGTLVKENLLFLQLRFCLCVKAPKDLIRVQIQK